MRDKDLFFVMIKYHPVVIGRLINKGLVEKTDDGFKMHEEDCEEDFSGHGFSFAVDDYQKIADSGIKYSKGPTTYGPCTSISNLQFVMENFADDLLFIHLPENYPRLTNSLKDIYIKILKKNVSRIHEKYQIKGYYITNVPGIYNYQDLAGYNYESWYKDILLKHDIFAYRFIYFDIEWDFDMVEEYKDQILWPNLMEDSNLTWNEARMRQFDSYIPHDKLGKRGLYTKTGIFYWSCGYKKVEKLSFSYIDSHKDVINWDKFLTTAEFEWNSDEMKYFFDYCETNGYSILSLVNNDRFTWTPDNLRTLIELEPYTIKYCISNRKLNKILLSIPNYQDIINNNNLFPDIFLQLQDGGEQPHNAYSAFFTIQNIEKNANDWNAILEEEFVTNRRTPDTNYHYHRAFTMWDYFLQNEEVSLTYDLCKYLQNITVNIGGMFVMEDGCYLGEDHRNQKYNGFDLFSRHKISSAEEIEKICNDPELLEAFLKKPNTYIIDYLIDEFFKDYRVEDYLYMINQMNDWDSVYEF